MCGADGGFSLLLKTIADGSLSIPNIKWIYLHCSSDSGSVSYGNAKGGKYTQDKFVDRQFDDQNNYTCTRVGNTDVSLTLRKPGMLTLKDDHTKCIN